MLGFRPAFRSVSNRSQSRSICRSSSVSSGALMIRPPASTQREIDGEAETFEGAEGDVFLVVGPAPESAQPAARQPHEVALPQGLSGGGVAVPQPVEPVHNGIARGHEETSWW